MVQALQYVFRDGVSRKEVVHGPEIPLRRYCFLIPCTFKSVATAFCTDSPSG